MQRPGPARPWGRLVAAVVACCLVTVGIARAIIGPLPSIDSRQEPPAPSTLVFDREGRLLYEAVDPNAGAHRPDAGGQPDLTAALAVLTLTLLYRWS